LVTAVDAKSWQHYLGGIIQFHCDNDLNHAAQIIGYDLTGLILLLNLLSTFSYLIQVRTTVKPVYNERDQKRSLKASFRYKRV
jgi:hypothetical protein